MSEAKASQPRIRVRDLVKSYNRLTVLKGIDLDAEEGSVVTLIGSSGSGKSTLLRCLNLLEIPDSGDIAIDGETLHFDGRKRAGGVDPRQIRRVRSSLGMVFQNFALWSHMTILENVIAAPVHVLGVPREQAVERAHALLRRVGIGDKHACFPVQLSGGQQQRAAIARSLAMKPQLMLFDEPTSALDPELVGEVLATIRELAKEGMTMILVTHEMTFARDAASRVVFMDEGRVMEEGDPATIFTAPRTERVRDFLTRIL